MAEDDHQTTGSGNGDNSADEAPPIEIDESLVNVEERTGGDYERKDDR